VSKLNELPDELDLTSEIKGDAKGIVFNIQRYSIHDGPGIRTVVFLKGCPLLCVWCSNPESQNLRPEVAHSDSLCKKCKNCVNTCPTQAITVNEKGIVINREFCTNCGKCLEVCQTSTLKPYGKVMTAGEVFREVQKDGEFYLDSGGGVTASGGEPLLQPVFLASIFQLCRLSNIHTAIETTGCVKTEALKLVMPYTNLLLYDVKFASAELHRQWTKQSNIQILNNLRFAVENNMRVVVRVPLIPGVTDTDAELRGIADIVIQTLRDPVVNLLPYHRFGEGKYGMLDREYGLDNLTRQDNAELERAKQIFVSAGIDTQIVG
jgi:pyruvate formate lyase activating enzyme